MKRAFLVQLMKGDEVEAEEVRYARWPKEAADAAALSIVPWGSVYRLLRVKPLVEGCGPQDWAGDDYFVHMERSVRGIEKAK